MPHSVGAYLELLLYAGSRQEQEVSSSSSGEGPPGWFALEEPFLDKRVVLRVCVAITCVLSMAGAAMILLSYACFKQIRTKARQVLVHLAVADFGTAAANFAGVATYFDDLVLRHNCTLLRDVGYATSAPPMAMASLNAGGSYNDAESGSSPTCKLIGGFCTAQAALSGFFTVASVLLTVTLALHIYLLVLGPHCSSARAKSCLVNAWYVFSWGTAGLVVSWLLATDRLGISIHGGSGWCSLKTERGGREDAFAVAFGNDLWIYTAFVMLAVLYAATHCYIKLNVSACFKFLDVACTLLFCFQCNGFAKLP